VVGQYDVLDAGEEEGVGLSDAWAGVATQVDPYVGRPRVGRQTVRCRQDVPLRHQHAATAVQPHGPRELVGRRLDPCHTHGRDRVLFMM